MKKRYKFLKILLGGIAALLVLMIGSMYFAFHRKLPEGVEGVAADQLALSIQNAVNHNLYNDTRYIQWTFRNKHHYKWDRLSKTVEVKWDQYLIELDLSNPDNNKVYNGKNQIIGDEAKKIASKAKDFFNNDSFWVVAPHKLFDNGVIRKLVILDDTSKGLLVTYPKGGSTPGDSYLWKVDQNYRPTSYQMWVSIIPIGGLEATWDRWAATESGALLSTKHELLGFGIPITNLRAWNE